MQPEISNDVKIGSLVMLFQSVEKSPAIDKTASDFDNANLKVKKIRKLIEQGILRCGHCMLHSWNAGSCVPKDDRKNHDH